MSAELERLYVIVGDLVGRQGAPTFSELDGRMPWPERGVYFVFEPGETRSFSPKASRMVRVGTHALISGSGSTLWARLRQHRGGRDGSGNHRGSVFRMHVGRALIERDGLEDRFPAWDRGSSAPRKVLKGETELEQRVSEIIGRMCVGWVAVLDESGPTSDRGLIERGAIALLASDGQAADPPSRGWLGRYAPAKAIRGSGLWNVNHVGDASDSVFLERLERWARRTA